MPGYIKPALHKFQHPTPTRPENAPHTWNPPVYGTKIQYIEAQEDIPLLPQKDVTRIEQLSGTLLSNVRVIDLTLILPVNFPAPENTQATTATPEKVIKLLDYCATHPEDKLQYHASDMILNVHRDDSYLS
jgi:hypothetical protein